MGFKVSRETDKDDKGGVLVAPLCRTVIVGYKRCSVVTTPLTHKDAVATGSPTVFAEYHAVARVTSKTTAGHKLITGEPTVFVP